MSDTRPIAVCMECRRQTRVPRYEVAACAANDIVPMRVTVCMRCSRQTPRMLRRQALRKEPQS